MYRYLVDDAGRILAAVFTELPTLTGIPLADTAVATGPPMSSSSSSTGTSEMANRQIKTVLINAEHDNGISLVGVGVYNFD